MKHRLAVCVASILLTGIHFVLAADYVTLPGGMLRSVLPADGKDALVQVGVYRLRSEPVTNAEFLEFINNHVDWRRGNVVPLFADSQYLGHWQEPITLGSGAHPNQPVTQVSWFAAAAYCESEGARLPTWYEWEFAAAADATRTDARDDAAWRERILAWYARPSTQALPVTGGAKNIYGIRDLHGLVWEWVDDFNALFVSSDNRDQGSVDRLKFCGAGALSMQDRENYAVLMRVAMLSSLQAANTTVNLGFRCAKSGGE